MGGPCQTCGRLGAIGFRLPGLYSQQSSRSYFWVCDAHIQDGENARSAAMAKAGVGRRSGQSAAPAPPKQGDLFGP